MLYYYIYTKGWKLLFLCTTSKRVYVSWYIKFGTTLLQRGNRAIWVNEKYIMKMGEKSRKNLPLVTLFAVMTTIPAIPNPIRSNLDMFLNTQLGCWWFSWQEGIFRIHWACLIIIKQIQNDFFWKEKNFQYMLINLKVEVQHQDAISL